MNKIQYSDQIYIILVITLSYLQIPLKTSLISIRSEYLNTSIKHWWTLNMVKTWVANFFIKSHYLLLKQHRFPVLIVFPGFDTHKQIFPDLCVLQNVFKIILLFTRIYMILRVVCKSRRYWNVVDMRYKIRRFQRRGGYGFHGRGVLIHTPRPAFVTVVKRDTGSYHVSCGITLFSHFGLVSMWRLRWKVLKWGGGGVD